jgi:hypothetical protein
MRKFTSCHINRFSIGSSGTPLNDSVKNRKERVITYKLKPCFAKNWSAMNQICDQKQSRACNKAQGSLVFLTLINNIKKTNWISKCML